MTGRPDLTNMKKRIPKSPMKEYLDMLEDYACPECGSAHTYETTASVDCKDAVVCICDDCGHALARPSAANPASFIQPDGKTKRIPR